MLYSWKTIIQCLSDKSIWLVFRRSWVWIPEIFLWIEFLSLSAYYNCHCNWHADTELLYIKRKDTVLVYYTWCIAIYSPRALFFSLVYVAVVQYISILRNCWWEQLTVFDCTNFIIRQCSVSIPKNLQASIATSTCMHKRLLEYKPGRLLDALLRKFVMDTAYVIFITATTT